MLTDFGSFYYYLCDSTRSASSELDNFSTRHCKQLQQTRFLQAMDVNYQRVSLNDDGDDSDDELSYEDDDALIRKPNERARRKLKCTRKQKIVLVVLVAIAG